ncbi:hypothetical protein LCGC14_0677270 [marine sediment metagenome]|uniref:Uncharacterized protein n=1 Tax=marine sediment metagenome TaxID=412755 RepID=A0A0F9TXA1_9ZZZZ
MKKEKLQKMSSNEYITYMKKQVSKATKASTFNGQTYEFYKGQFLLLREITNPSYRRDINFELLDKWRKEWEEDEKKHWFEQKQICGNCREEMVLNHGSNDGKEEIQGVRCPRCDSEVEITIPHEKGKTPRWKRSEK